MPASDQAPSSPDATLGELVAKMSEQTSRLVRDEVRLAQAEMAQKGKRMAAGAGLFGVAAVVALLGAGALMAAAILGLASVVAGWAAALIVAGVLLATAATAALAGKNAVSHGAPPLPTEAVASTKADISAVKEGIRS